jgi:hypothetical protein
MVSSIMIRIQPALLRLVGADRRVVRRKLDHGFWTLKHRCDMHGDMTHHSPKGIAANQESERDQGVSK